MGLLVRIGHLRQARWRWSYGVHVCLMMNRMMLMMLRSVVMMIVTVVVIIRAVA